MGRTPLVPRIAVIAFSLGLGVLEARAAVIRVPQDYATIQAAINAAATGDTVLVSRGTYSGPLVISGKTITLASEFINTGDPNDVTQTIVKGGNPMIGIDVTAVDTTVRGITFQNSTNGLSTAASRMNILDNRFLHAGGDALSRYLLIVPSHFSAEGSYGTDSSNVERPAPASACRDVQDKNPCP